MRIPRELMDWDQNRKDRTLGELPILCLGSGAAFVSLPPSSSSPSGARAPRVEPVPKAILKPLLGILDFCIFVVPDFAVYRTVLKKEEKRSPGVSVRIHTDFLDFLHAVGFLGFSWISWRHRAAGNTRHLSPNVC